MVICHCQLLSTSIPRVTYRQ